MAVNKVVLGEDTLIDLTGDTVSADKLAKGTTAHDMAGEPIVGTMEAGGGKVYTFTDGLTETDGTVKWNLNDRIKAGTGEGSVTINVNNEKTVDALGVCSLAFGRSGSYGNYLGSATGIISEGVGSLAFGDIGSHNNNSKNSIHSGQGGLAFGLINGERCKIISGAGGIAGGCIYSSQSEIRSFGGSSIAFGTVDSTSGNIETKLSSKCAFALGYGVKACSHQFVTGKDNIYDDNNSSPYARIVGNGTSNTSRSNAYTLDWQGSWHRLEA